MSKVLKIVMCIAGVFLLNCTVVSASTLDNGKGNNESVQVSNADKSQVCDDTSGVSTDAVATEATTQDVKQEEYAETNPKAEKDVKPVVTTPDENAEGNEQNTGTDSEEHDGNADAQSNVNVTPTANPTPTSTPALTPTPTEQSVSNGATSASKSETQEENNAEPQKINQQQNQTDSPSLIYKSATAATVPQQVTVDGKIYYTQNGKNLTGWYTSADKQGSRYYLAPNANGAAVTGLQLIDSKAYYFDENGVCYTSGAPTINGKKYWVTEDGSLQSGWIKYNGWAFYFNPKTYAAAVGVTNVEGKMYLFDKDGICYMTPGTPTVDGKKYWIGSDGTLSSGWLAFSGMKFYFDPKTYEVKTGINTIDGKAYYFDKDGCCYTKPGAPTINGKKYWVTEDGSLQSGWIKYNGWTFYFNPQTYAAAIGVTNIGGKMYLFDKDGICYNTPGTPTVDGKKYWIGSDGTLSSGWLAFSGMKFYFDPKTYEVKTGINTIDGRAYYFDKDGCCYTKPGAPTINGKKYWVTEDGSLQNGWIKYNGWTFYFNPKTYAAAIGVTNIGGKTYLFNNDGVQQVGKGTTAINGKKYLFDSNGENTITTGWFSFNNWTFYFDPATGAALTGFASVDGKDLYFNEDGVMGKGLLTVNNTKYYFNDDGQMLRNACVTVDGTKYCFNSDGTQKNELGQQVVDYALQFLGLPYAYGKESLTTGTDCSGFTMLVYAHFGYSLPHSAAAQSSEGVSVGNIANAKPGDILYYNSPYDHVAIYMGNNKMVEEPNEGLVCCVSDARMDYVDIRRIIE